MPKKHKPILEMKQISKAFPGVQALDKVDYDLYPGIHVLIGMGLKIDADESAGWRIQS